MGGLQQGDRGEQPPEAPVRFDLETPLLLQPSPPDSGRLSQPISRAPLDFSNDDGRKNLRVLDSNSTPHREANSHRPTPEQADTFPFPQLSISSSPAMSLSCRYAAQCCARQLRAAPIRASSSLLQQQRMTRRYNSTDAAAAVNPKISAIVDQISQLTLLETADLVASLKVRNNTT
jgi:hypothetical protein